MSLDSLFEIAKFSSFLEALVENVEYRRSLARPLEVLIEADKAPLVVKDWVAFWSDGAKTTGISLSAESWRTLAEMNTDELQVIERWLLDRVVREYGSGTRKKGHKTALELVAIVLHELARETHPDTFTAMVEQYLPLAQDDTLSSDLYQWLFSCSFNPDAPTLDAYLLAVHGLEKANLGGDSERIGWSAYNLATYHSFLDTEEAERVLEEHLVHMQDERYYDVLGNIALKYLEDRKIERGRAYLQTVWLYTIRFSAQEPLPELQSIAFNLAFYALNLAWIYFDDGEFRKSIQVLSNLHKILLRERSGFLKSARDLGSRPVDWAYQYYVHVAETYLWLYACHEELGQEERAHDVLAEFQHFKLTSPYDLEPITKEFFLERGKGELGT